MHPACRTKAIEATTSRLKRLDNTLEAVPQTRGRDKAGTIRGRAGCVECGCTQLSGWRQPWGEKQT